MLIEFKNRARFAIREKSLQPRNGRDPKAETKQKVSRAHAKCQTYGSVDNTAVFSAAVHS